MRSVMTSAVLATALLGQAFARATPGHHAHLHHAKKAEDAAVKRQEVVVTMDGKVVSWENDYFGPSTTTAAAATVAAATTTAEATTEAAAEDVASVVSSVASEASSVVSAAVATASAETSTDLTAALDELMSANSVLAAVANDLVANNADGEFVFDITNNSGDTVVLVVWTGTDGEDDWTSMCVQAYAPALAIAIGDGDCETISFPGSTSTSGAFSVLSSKSTMYDSWIANTWVEYTVSTASTDSTIDVSKIMSSDGNDFSVQLYDAKTDGSKTCLTDMTRCVYTATDTLSNCPVGTGSNTTADASLTDGGCSFVNNQGYATVTIS